MNFLYIIKNMSENNMFKREKYMCTFIMRVSYVGVLKNMKFN